MTHGTAGFAMLLALVGAAPSARAQEQAVVHGLLPIEAVRRVVHRTSGVELRRCYGERLAARPGLEGRWTVRLIIAADGRTTAVEVRALGTADPDLERCVRAALGGLVFPSTGGGVTLVTWPFDFTLAPPPRGTPRVRLDARRPYEVRPALVARPVFGSAAPGDPHLAIRSSLGIACEAFVDGVDLGSSPLLVRLPVRDAPYHLSIQAEGYRGYEADVDLRAGRALIVEVRPRLAVVLRECPLRAPGSPGPDELCAEAPRRR